MFISQVMVMVGVTKSSYMNYIAFRFNMLEAEEFGHKCYIGTI